MPELTATQETALRTMVASLAPALSNAMSESIGRLVLVDDPVLAPVTVAEMTAYSEPLVQTTWSFPTLSVESTQHALMILRGGDALEVSAFLSGSAAPQSTELTDDLLTHLAPMMEGTAAGFGVGFGNAVGSTLDVAGVACAVGPISVGSAFLVDGGAAKLNLSFHIQDGPDGELTVYLTSALSAALAERAAPAASLPFTETPERLPGQSNPFQPFETASSLPGGVSRSMELIMDIPLEVSVELGRVQMLIRDVLELATGSIVELERVAGEPVDLLVNGQLIAKGEVVVIEDNFGVRITEIVSPADRLHGVGKRAA